MGSPFGPAAADWSYFAPNPLDFYSLFISNGQRLPNGNTLINEGVFGHLQEVTPQGAVVWEYTNPVDDSGRLAPGDTPSPGPSGTLNNRTLRVYRYPADYAGLQGRDLSPGDYLALEASDFDCSLLTDAQGPAAPSDLIRFSPNPSAGPLEINWRGPKPAQLRMIDLHGREHLAEKILPGSNSLSLAKLPSGLYILLVDGQYSGRIARIQ